LRILLVTDAWHPQVNGVVRTLHEVVRELARAGHVVRVIHPGLFRGLPCPTYPEIRLALFAGRGLLAELDDFRPEAIHVATEGPLGLAARSLCRREGLPFTTSFHTRFPEYVRARCGIPEAWTYAGLRWFHGAAERVLVATERLARELEGRGFASVARWSRGVDAELFHPEKRVELALPRPIHLYVGRLAVEKDVGEFLRQDLPGTKLVVGDGPERAELQRCFPEAVFTGALRGEDLARMYASADVFVFPSRTDTFGLVLLEALASGLPVAALPVPGPLDVLGNAPVAVLDADLGRAARAALRLDRTACREFALRSSWSACAARFVEHLAPFRATRGSRVEIGPALEAP
jgi:glycosyltransferase involved in cell wall biosynthesis